MKPLVISILTLTTAALLSTAVPSSQPTTQPSPDPATATALESGRLPPGYRDWKLISVAREEGKIDDIRAILGNDLALKAYRENIRPFPDGAIIARLAWSLIPSEENNQAFGQPQSHIAGPPKNGVQFMLKNSTKYASTGGWSYSQFFDGKPLKDAAKLEACFTCHQAVSDPSRDYLFTHYAP